jgi:hypothetical protein
MLRVVLLGHVNYESLPVITFHVLAYFEALQCRQSLHITWDILSNQLYCKVSGMPGKFYRRVFFTYMSIFLIN